MGASFEAQARAFADQTSSLLNRTVTNGIRISVVTRGVHAILGCGITAANLVAQPIPIAVSSAPRVWLDLIQSYSLDDEGIHLTMTRGSLSLYSSAEMKDGTLIVALDYNRDPPNAYPAAHLHVDGRRDDLERIYLGDRAARKLRDLHLPVGGKRFRPTLEDLIVFIVTERMVEPRAGWEQAVAEDRQKWEAIQIKAAVRRNQDIAAAALEAEGWKLIPPS